MTNETLSPPMSPMADAISRHDPIEIHALSLAGHTLKAGEAPVRLIAEGYDPYGIDPDEAGLHPQQNVNIELTLKAASAAGIDINTPVDKEPAAHFLTRTYVTRQISEHHNRPLGAQKLLREAEHEDDDHIDHLLVYALNGVDFSQRDEQGRTFIAAGEEAARAHVASTTPHTMGEDYLPTSGEDRPRFSDIKGRISRELRAIKLKSVGSRVTAIAEQKAEDFPVPKSRKQKDAGLEI